SPGNIMISEEGQATLVDFGLSRIAAHHLTSRPWFTPGYAAPEIFSGEYTPATDRYAFGAIAWFALTGEEPPTAPEQLRERFGALPLLAGAGERQRELVMSMFSAEPRERPSTTDWIRALRTLATSVPWTGPTEDPADDEDTEPSAPDPRTTEARAVPGWLDVDKTPGGGAGPRPGSGPPAPPAGPPLPGQPPRPVAGPRSSAPEQRPPAPPHSGPPSAGPQGMPHAAHSGPAGSPPGPPPGPKQGASQPVPEGPRPVPPPGPSPSGPTHAGAQPYAPTTVTVTRPTQEKNSDTDKKGKRSRKPLLIAFTIVAVLFLILGASATFYVLDRFGYLTCLADGPDDVVAEQDPSPSPTQSADPEADRTEPDTEESREEPTEESVPGSDEMLLTQMDP